MLRVTASIYRRHVGKKRMELARQLNTSLCLMVYQDEPDYLKYLKPQVPVYEQVNIEIKSYDFTVLEHFARAVHKLLINMEVDVGKAWASPHQALCVTNTDLNSTKVSNEFRINLYERNIQVTTLPAYSAYTCFEFLQSMLPAGVSVSIHTHEPHHDEYRYIPDFELIDLKRKRLEVEATVDPDKADELVEVVKQEKLALKLAPKSKK